MKISKKIMAAALAVLMTVSIIACSSSGAGSSAAPGASPSASQSDKTAAPSAASPSTAATPAAGASASASAGAAASPSSGLSLSKRGYFDPNTDYSKRDKYKIAFLIQSTPSSMHQMFIEAYKRWGTKMNYDLKDFTANNSSDDFINDIQTLATQGYNGYFLDFADEIRDRVLDVTKELNLKWFPGLSKCADKSGNLLWPSESMDNETSGEDMTKWLDKAAKETWGNFDHKSLGMICVNYSVIADIQARETGAHKKFQELYPDIASTNYWMADGVTQNNFNAEAGYNIVSPILASHPEIKYWIIASTMDDFAEGASRAAEAANKQNNTLIIATGGTTLVAEWDKGLQSCWKACIYYEADLAAGTICAGLVSMINGDTTPETLWPEWIKPGQKYALYLSPCYLVTHDNYQEFFGWCDQYTGFKLHNYPYHGTQFQFNQNP